MCAWLDRRNIDWRSWGAWQLAAALPKSASPRWGRAWAMGWRCILPTYDASGRRASWVGRWVKTEVPPQGLKERKPAGVRAMGLMFADPMGRRMLAGEDVAGVVPELVIVEGAPDFLFWATEAAREFERGEDWRCRAVLGLFSGSWTDASAARVPDGMRVVVATHHDEAGEAYALAVTRSLAGRCEVRRTLRYTDHTAGVAA